MKIQLEALTKEYKDVKAVKDLSMVIDEGSLVCLLGPSGCGKSTTLAMIAGLEKPTSGQIYFNGEKVKDLDSEYRDIGMVFQDYALYPHMTVMDNIAFPLKMMKLKKSDRVKRVNEVARILKLEELLNRKPSKLSGGQQQRVAIARAIVKKPKILLLDEPLSNLDARLRLELRDEIRNLQRKLQITTIFVTHDQEEALSISDKILLLKDGVLQQYSTPKDMYMAPNNKFVAGFLGNPPMNFLKGNYDYGKIFMAVGEELEEIFSENITVSEEFKRENVNSSTCTLGIRPEDLIPCNENEGIEGEITSVQTLGKEVYIRFQVKGINLSSCTSWDNNYDIGDKIYFKARGIHIFK